MNDAQRMTELIQRRRTIKPAQMSDRPVDEAVVWQLLENANWAPTHGMTEPWRFVVFTGAARHDLARLLPEIYRAVTPPTEFKQRKVDALGENPLRAPVLIVTVMKRQASQKIPEVEEVEAVACAVQNLHLTAAAYGLGGFWSSNAAVCSAAMHEFLQLEPHDRVLGLFYLGYPAGTWPTSSRTPIEDKVIWRREDNAAGKKE